MKKLLLLLFLLTFLPKSIAQQLYSKAFGNPKDKAIIFLHGGPGYNCAGFEATTAQLLADEGFYVIVYDRRGEGRSQDGNAKFTFRETFDDLDQLYKKYDIAKAVLMGHSFGGILAVLYAESHPEKTDAVELVSAPVSLQESFRTILRSCRKIYTDKNDAASLKYIDMIEKMDPKSAEYFTYTFSHAMQNGFYSPKNKSEQAKAISEKLKSSDQYKYASRMTREAPQGFLKNESYTSIDLTENLKKLVASKVPVFGIYGKDDGLYSQEQVSDLQKIIGEKNLVYLEDASHNVFIDQQKSFLETVKKFSKAK